MSIENCIKSLYNIYILIKEKKIFFKLIYFFLIYKKIKKFINNIIVGSHRLR